MGDMEIFMKLRAIQENHLYSKVYSKGKKFVGQRVIVYTLPDWASSRIQKSDPLRRRTNRVGITVTKKIGGAVERNRAKRIIREGYRRADAALHMKKGQLVVIVARMSIIDAKSQDIENDIRAAIKKLQNSQSSNNNGKINSAAGKNERTAEKHPESHSDDS